MRSPKTIVPGRFRGRPGGAVLVVLTLFIAGCGTDVKRLIGEESQMAWDAHQVAMDAGAFDPNLEELIYAAEQSKLEACREIDKSVAESVRNGGINSFGEQFLTDLSLLMALLFPLAPVERCAEAHENFKQEFQSVQTRLESYERETQ